MHSWLCGVFIVQITSLRNGLCCTLDIADFASNSASKISKNFEREIVGKTEQNIGVFTGNWEILHLYGARDSFYQHMTHFFSFCQHVTLSVSFPTRDTHFGAKREQNIERSGKMKAKYRR